MINKIVALSLMVSATFNASAQQKMEAGLDLKYPLISEVNLSTNDIGSRFTVLNGIKKEDVILVGFDSRQKAIAYSLTDFPQIRENYSSTLSYCQNKGEGWYIPDTYHLKMATKFINDLDGLKPGNYWSSTTLPCDQINGCKKSRDFKVTYGIRGGNVKNFPNTDLFKQYPICAYTPPN